MDVITVGSNDLVVDVAPVHGGRVSQIRAGETPLLIDRSDEFDAATAWGAYPMVPWAGRIRNGRFTFGGDVHELPINMGPHAIHGVGFTSAWEVVAADDASVRLSLDLPTDDSWPFGGRAEQQIDVHSGSARFAMSVTATDRSFPVTFGWHPWFRKPTAIDFRPSAMYRRDDAHIAIDELVDVPDGPWDDCFVNDQPVRLRIDGVDVELSSECRHWVVYDEPAHATCVEPQTGPPDAFNIAPHVLHVGDTLTAEYRLRVLGPDAALIS